MLQHTGAPRTTHATITKLAFQAEWPGILENITETKDEKHETYKDLSNCTHASSRKGSPGTDLKRVGANPGMYQIEIDGSKFLGQELWCNITMATRTTGLARVPLLRGDRANYPNAMADVGARNVQGVCKILSKSRADCKSSRTGRVQLAPRIRGRSSWETGAPNLFPVWVARFLEQCFQVLWGGRSNPISMCASSCLELTVL